MAGIGGSDAAAVLGVPTARNTALEVYRSKVQEPEHEDQPLGQLLWGSLLEGAIADHYAMTHNLLLRTPGTIVRPGEPIVGTLDRIVQDGTHAVMPPERGLEVKTADRSMAAAWGKAGSDVIPEEYWVQVQHYYMVVPTLIRLDVAVLIGGNDYREYQIKRDDSFVRDLQIAERSWWDRHVVPRFPPPVTEHDVATLKKLYPGTNGETVNIAQVAHWHAAREEALAKIRQLTAVCDVAEAEILAAMGEAAIGELPGGKKYRRKLIERESYSVEQSKYMDLRLVGSRR